MKSLSEEVRLHHLLRPRRGLLVDVGAHTGEFTFSVDKGLYDTIIAVEPLPFAADHLRKRSSELNSPITIIQKALSDHSGKETLSVPITKEETVWQWASIEKNFESMRDRLTDIIDVKECIVDVETLDSLLLTNVASMKIDVEGAEEEVLKGAENTLCTSRPVVSVELEERHRHDCILTVPKFMEKLSYRAFFMSNGALFDLSKFDRNTMQVAHANPSSNPISRPYINCFFFIPEENNLILKKAIRTGSRRLLELA